MDEIRPIQAEVFEIPIYPNTDRVFYVRERPIEAIGRRLKELGLSYEDVANTLYPRVPLETITRVLDEEEYSTIQLTADLLALVGLEEVAIRSQHPWQDGRGGHWYHGERCVYCRVNYYDAMLYGPEECPESRLTKQSE